LGITSQRTLPKGDQTRERARTKRDREKGILTTARVETKRKLMISIKKKKKLIGKKKKRETTAAVGPKRERLENRQESPHRSAKFCVLLWGEDSSARKKGDWICWLLHSPPKREGKRIGKKGWTSKLSIGERVGPPWFFSRPFDVTKGAVDTKINTRREKTTPASRLYRGGHGPDVQPGLAMSKRTTLKASKKTTSSATGKIAGTRFKTTEKLPGDLLGEGRKWETRKT